MTVSHCFLAILFVLPFRTASIRRFSRAALSAPEDLVDITNIAVHEDFKAQGWRCCCDKYKGFKDTLRRTKHSGVCKIFKAKHCGNVQMIPKLHYFKRTGRQCDVLPEDVEGILRQWSPKDYCKATALQLGDGGVQASVSTSGSLGQAVPYECPAGWQHSGEKNTVECQFGTAAAGVFTQPHCEDATQLTYVELCNIARSGPLFYREDRRDLALYLACHDERGQLFEICFYKTTAPGFQTCQSAKLHLEAQKLSVQGQFEIPLNSGIQVHQDTLVRGAFRGGRLKDGQLTVHILMANVNSTTHVYKIEALEGI